MNERDFNNMQESAAVGAFIAENLQTILDSYGVKNVHELYRSLYRDTDCGVWLSVQTHDGEWKRCDELRDIDNGNVRALRVGCIIEGGDAEVFGKVVDLLLVDTPKEACDEFNKEFDAVQEQADELWHDCHD